jgi:prevent-host-death family protein
MKKIAAAEFKAKCLTLMEDVQSTREPIVIAKRGKAMAKLVPADDAAPEFIGRLKGLFEIVGDLDDEPPAVWESSF